MKKFSSQDLMQRIIWALIGYFANFLGIVDLPVPL
jgi:hypothetical protein